MRKMLAALAILAGAFPTLAAAQGSTNILEQQAIDTGRFISSTSTFLHANRLWEDQWRRLPDTPVNQRLVAMGDCILEAAPASAIRFANGEGDARPLRPAFDRCGSDGLRGDYVHRAAMRRGAILEAIERRQIAVAVR